MGREPLSLFDLHRSTSTQRDGQLKPRLSLAADCRRIQCTENSTPQTSVSARSRPLHHKGQRTTRGEVDVGARVALGEVWATGQSLATKGDRESRQIEKWPFRPLVKREELVSSKCQHTYRRPNTGSSKKFREKRSEEARQIGASKRCFSAENRQPFPSVLITGNLEDTERLNTAVEKNGYCRSMTSELTTPRLLDGINSFLREKLRALSESYDGKNSIPPAIDVLEVYRESFDILIEEFKTYQPVFSRIKDAYDAAIHELQKQVHDYTSCRTALDSFEERKALEISSMRHAHELAMAEARKKARLAKEHARATEEKCSEEVTVAAKVNAQLEAEARRLRERTKELEETNKSYMTSWYAMQMKLKRREELEYESMLERMNLQRKIEANNAHIEKLEDKMALMLTEEELQKKLSGLHLTIKEQEEKVDILSNQVDRLLQENSRLKGELSALRATRERELEERMRLRLSPQPDWDSALDRIDSAYSKKRASTPPPSFTEVGSTRGRVDLLCSEVIRLKKKIRGLELDIDDDEGVATHPDVEAFRGLGIEGNVPKYLRLPGTAKIRNRKIARREMLSFINDLWTRKRLYEEKNKRVVLIEYLGVYLHERFGIQAMISEWGYSALAAMDKYSSSDPAIHLFSLVLSQTLPDDVYEECAALPTMLKNCLTKEDKGVHSGKLTGKLTAKEVLGALKEAFPFKTDRDLRRLRNALVKDCPNGSKFSYKKVLDDKEEEEPCVLKELLLQLERDELSFRAEIIFILEGVEADGEGNAKTPDVLHALRQVDPERTESETIALFAVGCGLPPASLAGLLRPPRSGKPSETEATSSPKSRWLAATTQLTPDHKQFTDVVGNTVAHSVASRESVNKQLFVKRLISASIRRKSAVKSDDIALEDLPAEEREQRERLQQIEKDYFQSSIFERILQLDSPGN